MNGFMFLLCSALCVVAQVQVASRAPYGSGGAGDLAVHFCLPQPIWLFLLHSLPFIIVVAAQPFPLSFGWPSSAWPFTLPLHHKVLVV